MPFGFFWVKDPKGAWGLHADPAAHVMYLFKHLIWGGSQRNELNITLVFFFPVRRAVCEENRWYFCLQGERWPWG